MRAKWLKRSKSALTAIHVVRNWQRGFLFRMGYTRASAGSTHSTLDLPASLSYIDRVYADYLYQGGLTPADLHGWRILEIGPGDNLGVALRFLLDGVQDVTCVDKYHARRDPAHHLRIYRAMRERLGTQARARFDDAVRLDNDAVCNPRRLRYLCGVGAERADRVLAGEHFDLIVSRAVVEEISEPEAALRAMDRLLKPGGLMVHKIDLRDYAVFPRDLYHPLTFLTVRDRLYRLMTSHTPASNRRRIGDYRQIMTRMGYDATFLVTHMLGTQDELPVPTAEANLDPALARPASDLISAIRPRLAARFRNRDDGELAVMGIFLTARKPLA
jgi:SAM-dependent methyltransferase